MYVWYNFMNFRSLNSEEWVQILALLLPDCVT